MGRAMPDSGQSRSAGGHVKRAPGSVQSASCLAAWLIPECGEAPAEADMQRHFRVSPPSVHQMVIGLERDGFIRRQPGIARSIDILLPTDQLPICDWLNANPSKPL